MQSAWLFGPVKSTELFRQADSGELEMGAATVVRGGQGRPWGCGEMWVCGKWGKMLCLQKIFYLIPVVSQSPYYPVQSRPLDQQ